MGTSLRVYLREESGKLRRISQRLLADLRTGKVGLPEYASTSQRIIALLLYSEERVPHEIDEVQGQIWRFDKDGKVHEDLWREHCARVSLLPGAKGDLPDEVVDIRPVFERRKLDAETRWTVPDDVMEAVIVDLRRQAGLAKA